MEQNVVPETAFGPVPVGSPEIEPSHHPDAFRLRPYATEPSNLSSEKELLLGVPWQRFRPPVHADVIVNDSQPAFLYSSHCIGPIEAAQGPWVSEGSWWESQSWVRAEWDVAINEGIYRLVQAGEGWFLDGIYA